MTITIACGFSELEISEPAFLFESKENIEADIDLLFDIVEKLIDKAVELEVKRTQEVIKGVDALEPAPRT